MVGASFKRFKEDNFGKLAFLGHKPRETTRRTTHDAHFVVDQKVIRSDHENRSRFIFGPSIGPTLGGDFGKLREAEIHQGPLEFIVTDAAVGIVFHHRETGYAVSGIQVVVACIFALMTGPYFSSAVKIQASAGPIATPAPAIIWPCIELLEMQRDFIRAIHTAAEHNPMARVFATLQVRRRSGIHRIPVSQQPIKWCFVGTRLQRFVRAFRPHQMLCRERIIVAQEVAKFIDNRRYLDGSATSMRPVSRVSPRGQSLSGCWLGERAFIFVRALYGMAIRVNHGCCEHIDEPASPKDGLRCGPAIHAVAKEPHFMSLGSRRQMCPVVNAKTFRPSAAPSVPSGHFWSRIKKTVHIPLLRKIFAPLLRHGMLGIEGRNDHDLSPAIRGHIRCAIEAIPNGMHIVPAQDITRQQQQGVHTLALFGSKGIAQAHQAIDSPIVKKPVTDRINAGRSSLAKGIKNKAGVEEFFDKFIRCFHRALIKQSRRTLGSLGIGKHPIFDFIQRQGAVLLLKKPIIAEAAGGGPIHTRRDFWFDLLVNALHRTGRLFTYLHRLVIDGRGARAVHDRPYPCQQTITITKLDQEGLGWLPDAVVVVLPMFGLEGEHAEFISGGLVIPETAA